MKPRALATLALVPLLAACGSGGSDTTTTSSSGTTSETNSSTNAEDRTVTLGCAGSLRVKGAEITSTGNDASVAWVENDDTTGETPSEYISYIVTITSADGQKSKQLAKKMYVTGDTPSQFIYDTGTLAQTNLTPSGGSDPSNINDAVLSFPGALDGIGPGWKASGIVNIDGQDALTCSSAS